MNKNELFLKISSEIADKIRFLNDKPEENLESTLKALWLMAGGIPVSAEKALQLPLPELTAEQEKLLYKFINQRINNTPLAHITGRQQFMGIELLTDKRALIPRKETEILGKIALEKSIELSKKKEEVYMVDVCCGAGNIAVSIAALNKTCNVYAADISNEAVELARDNINFHKLSNRVQATQSDLFSAFENDKFYNKIDLITCNPPYISSAKVIKMDTEISSNEPSLAFDGGTMGLKVIQKLVKEAPKFLVSSGWLCFEVGLGQGDFITKICERSNAYQRIENATDKSGNVRVIMVQNK